MWCSVYLAQEIRRAVLVDAEIPGLLRGGRQLAEGGEELSKGQRLVDGASIRGSLTTKQPATGAERSSSSKPRHTLDDLVAEASTRLPPSLNMTVVIKDREGKEWRLTASGAE